MLAQISPLYYEFHPEPRDPRSLYFINDLRQNIPADFLEHDPENNLWYISIFFSEIVENLYKKHFYNPQQLELLSENRLSIL
jgi:hypothetical protein